MNQPRDFHSTNTDTPVGFAHEGQSEGLFTRYLTLRGEKAYSLSFSCGTCYFLFSKESGAHQTVDVRHIDGLFRQGISRIDDTLLAQIAPIIPAGQYTVCLEEITPRLVSPCAEDDYFSHEQLALWGVEPTTGLPHYPGTEYYRTRTQLLGEGTALFEFVVPMVPKNWLDEDNWQIYIDAMQRGEKPTCLAIAVIDDKQPAEWKDNPAINRHLCLAHFLLDGHHKLYAASLAGMPITLLTFIARDECIADAEDIDRIASIVALP